MRPSEIVPMAEAHVAAVAALERCCFSAPWSEQSVREELSNPLSLWLVALLDGQLAGYVGSQTVLDEADMMNLAVDPACRRQGIARALVEALTAALAERGVRSLTLEVRASNEGAIALYRTLGFAQVGRRPNYYTKPREDALILRKEWSL
ncbi:MAG TPA: ribosomal protein S18-alanine N-acetyltransferase [Candidatus Avoscillospira avicola]|uniref:[Ribosomal protein bS18]-alanine N-acetyltransferase n=1 Tax=Candidatus Avoscillospira avicola TaxID=2840706 RepID=A0A9D1IV05_9FIRM|nr:ribosomal protein S18-alanine N-acetyltransferase [Candidatus Avoscillospira avicola]